MHVLITGGTGLIGRALTSALLSDGHQVTIISRSAQRPAGIPEPVGILSWEQAREQGWDATLRGVDAVVNLAGENLAGAGLLPERWTPQKKERILRSRVEVGERLTQAIASSSHKPSVFVQASASGYYGPQGDEDHHRGACAGKRFPGRRGQGLGGLDGRRGEPGGAPRHHSHWGGAQHAGRGTALGWHCL
jgi:NAD dependent epimerase/dehydratase family enzyme